MTTAKTYAKELTANKPEWTIKVTLKREGINDSYAIELWGNGKKMTGGQQVTEVAKSDPNYRQAVTTGKTYKFGVAYIDKAKAQEIENAMAELANESPKTPQQIKYETILPGLEKIKKAVEEQENWRDNFSSAMEDENRSAFISPAPKNVIEETMNAYPEAAAYYKAERHSYASHYAKSCAGRRAMDKILSGVDYNQALREMENEWSTAANDAVWNN